MVDKLFRIQSGYQNYDWGKLGSSSAVAQFAHNSSPQQVIIDELKPYAELWMGTHPRLPSLQANTGLSLRELIEENPEELLGSKVLNGFQTTSDAAYELPFLFKVLSIEKVLSIQAHPDKNLAKILHKNDPKNYPDDNHKPEMAIAVTSFEGFCGFKPLNQIKDHLIKIPEFYELIGNDIAEKFINGININSDIKEGSEIDLNNRLLLRLIFDKVMNSSDEEIFKTTEKLLLNTLSNPEIFTINELPELIQRLNKQFPNDIGLICGCLLLNHCKLEAGQAMFLKAKDPHAYISGDIIECMAASDNVVRAGFTPKFKDVKNLVEMLNYSYDDVSKQIMEKELFERSSGNGESILYDPPIEEFSVLQTTFKNSIGIRKFEKFDGPSILIITNGSGKIKSNEIELDAEIGFNFFIAPNVEIELITEDAEFTSYRAFVEV